MNLQAAEYKSKTYSRWCSHWQHVYTVWACCFELFCFNRPIHELIQPYFSAMEQCFLLTIFQYKHQHKPDFKNRWAAVVARFLDVPKWFLNQFCSFLTDSSKDLTNPHWCESAITRFGFWNEACCFRRGKF